jgi:AcrR family transcriptional regulator
MQTKKENIIKIALELFSSQGFDNTSTSLIAKRAEVSEGLIFRHFTNKEGLLNEILLEGITKIKPSIDLILLESEPVKIISKTLELPYKIISEHREFWKLQVNLRHRNDNYRKDFDDNNFFEPLNSKIENAFLTLDFANPKIETEIFFITITGLGLYFIDNDNPETIQQIINNLKLRYTK